MEIKILGTGCAKCKAALDLFSQVMAAEGVQATLTKVEDMSEIMQYGIMSTPGILVDGELKMVGRVPSRAQIRQWLTRD